MTPTQLRAFAAVVRLGSVKRAAAELDVSEAAVSLHVAQLRKELGDRLFTRTASGLAFTPGGLRLASRGAEMLSLQERTIIEVGQAGDGRRLLRVATSSLFAEHAAPGLIGLFAGRADDLDVELSVHDPRQFGSLLHSRTVDVAIGPNPGVVDETLACKPFLNYQIVLVCGPDHPLAGRDVGAHQLRDQLWLLGPSAASDLGAVPKMLRRLNVPRRRLGHADTRRTRRPSGSGRTGQIRHDPPCHPGHAPWPRRDRRPLPPVHPHHPLELTARSAEEGGKEGAEYSGGALPGVLL